MSRSTRPSPFGKRTAKVQTWIADHTKVLLAQKWMSLGYATESEYVAEVVEAAVHGRAEVLKIHAARLDEVLGIGRK
jgi:hypothetical protein